MVLLRKTLFVLQEYAQNTRDTHANTHTRARTHTHTCTCTHTRAHTHTHAHIHTRAHTHTCTCTHTHVHTHTRTHARTHTHTSIFRVLKDVGQISGRRLGPVHSQLKSFVGEVASLTSYIHGLGGYWVPGRWRP